MPASNTPKRKRVVMNPAQFLTKPWHKVTSPKQNMQTESQTCGFNLLRMMFEGISKSTYGMKKIMSAV